MWGAVGGYEMGRTGASFSTFFRFRPYAPRVDTFIVVTAQYVPFLVPLAGLIVWLMLDRQGKLTLGVRSVIAFALALILIKVFQMAHNDPRPFVVNPAVKPLFPHVADNGFPSDHTTMVVTVSLLVILYRRWLGVALLVVSAFVGWARVASHVHHTQDIVAGAVIGIIAVAVGMLAEPPITRWWTARRQVAAH